MKAGLALQPQALQVSLVDRPLADLLFTQFMASVSGKVYCLGNSRSEIKARKCCLKPRRRLTADLVLTSSVLR